MKKKVKNYLLKLIAKTRTAKGFTLIEMVVVVAIIVLLILIIAPNLTKQKKNAEERTDEAFKTTLQTQANLYEDDRSRNGKEISFANMYDAGYLTKNQYEKSKKYTLNDGTVEKAH
ncbi:competence type IV pilus major pilin ComGC [Lactobacillus sp. ESL0791]|uniref:competence type IV pilus major pilin ComGC n=1 Tax=Lactobacillus sp. ESL0791 TaxID=2983234 RepID=UPI0023F95F52|nr:competence type IV pilus major pilin ComGC [Lactobacillus sp. ESL0791]MDF7638688.1 competence type IV pilus major pilin ComGC [Lactobacillus sp. ESL0791]